MNYQYIYLIQVREFVNLNECIYKLGKTQQVYINRFKQYPKGSILLSQQPCYDCDSTEKELIQLFKTKYVHRTDIGHEYFMGDCLEMIYDNNVYINTFFKNNEKCIISQSPEDQTIDEKIALEMTHLDLETL